MLTLIRTDASSAIGLGHLRRCLSLATALRSLGGEVRIGLSASDVDAVAIALEDGFQAKVLPSSAIGDVTDVDDAVAFLALWPDSAVDWVVLDHYQLGADWQTQVRQRLGCRLATIDDLANRPLDTDLLIDHNFVPAPGHRTRYAPWLRRDPQAWLCGPRFALLGPAYGMPAPFEVAPVVRSIGIFLGGTDPAGLSARALQACRAQAGFSGPIEVVSTSANPALAVLRSCVAQDRSARLTVDLPDLAGFFGRHDLQIGAGGGATWERCCVGVPTLTLGVADNQQAVISGLQALGAILSPSDNLSSTIGQAMKALIASHTDRQALSNLGRTLVDGRGAQRVALVMAVRTGHLLDLRPVGMEHAHLLWSWRNDLATRAVSREAGAIPWSAHKAWMGRALADGNRLLWLAHMHDTPVGVIRFDALPDMERQDQHEVSLYLDPGLHGLGLGLAMLTAGEQALARRHGSVTVHAEVLADNPASQRLFVAAGYRAASAFTFKKLVALSPKGVGVVSCIQEPSS